MRAMRAIRAIPLVREERGQAVVELALVLSILLLVLLGIFTFGQIMNTYLTVTYAAREGARAGALGGTDADVATAVLAAMPSTLDKTKVATTTTPAAGARPRGTAITVTVMYPLPINIPLIANAIGRTSLTLLGTTTMRAE
jgi:Flp pilus assembly protein TadG